MSLFDCFDYCLFLGTYLDIRILRIELAIRKQALVQGIETRAWSRLRQTKRGAKRD